MHIVPRPETLELRDGECLLMGPATILYRPEDQMRDLAELVAAQLSSDGLLTFNAADCYQRSQEPTVRLSLEPGCGLPEGAYELLVQPTGVMIEAPSDSGLFYGAQTLRQIISTTLQDSATACALPCLYIRDMPRFGWRGFLLDCSRSFLTAQTLKRYMDLMAYYKFNVLQLHLTDNEGWRLEIESHPALTEIGGGPHPLYPEDHAGFYTKAEVRDLLNYAQARQITIVPEIEMPSHFGAAVRTYPDLECPEDQFTADPYADIRHKYPPDATFRKPGVCCIGNDRAFEVIEDVLAEVIELFPSQHIHIGGDECPKRYWKVCPKCQKRIANEGLKDELELQSYFIKRIEMMISSRGRTLVGWDEILEGGLAPNAVVMSWRGEEGGVAAASEGHDVIMTPNSHCYYDLSYESIPLAKAYSYDPIPAALDPKLVGHIIGGQGCKWTHVARTEPEIDFMVLPRFQALAEVFWSPKDARDYGNFLQRLDHHFAWLDKHGFRYNREAAV